MEATLQVCAVPEDGWEFVQPDESGYVDHQGQYHLDDPISLPVNGMVVA